MEYSTRRQKSKWKWIHQVRQICNLKNINEFEIICRNSNWCTKKFFFFNTVEIYFLFNSFGDHCFHTTIIRSTYICRKCSKYQGLVILQPDCVTPILRHYYYDDRNTIASDPQSYIPIIVIFKEVRKNPYAYFHVIGKKHTDFFRKFDPFLISRSTP